MPEFDLSRPDYGSGRPSISVAMIANNEERNLPRTLAALAGWVGQIVIIDSGSTDRSPHIARQFGAEHSFHRDFRGHPEQKNIAIARCTGDWILLLDADEVVSPALAEEMQAAVLTPDWDAFLVPRLNLFLTRWMRHGGLYPDQKLRLFRRGAAAVDETIGPHGTPRYEGRKGRLRHPLLHYGYPDFAEYLAHMNEYSSGAVDALERRHAGSAGASLLLQSVGRPLLGWVKNYLLRGGFLDGAAGFLFHLNHAVYVHWKYVKVWERRNLRAKHG